MTAAELLAELRKLDVSVALDGDRLRLDAPAGVLTDEHKRDLAQRKPEVVAFLREAQRLAVQQRAIVPLQVTGTRAPIFAVAGHNGDVFAYRALVQHLAPVQPFFGLQPPGLEEGSTPLTSVEDMARYFAEQIRAFRPAGPLSIAGYCAGGTVAFELARQLTDAGADVTNLILFGAPYCTSYRPLRIRAAQARYLAERSVTHARALLSIPATERRQYLSARLRRLMPHRAAEISDPVLIRRRSVEETTMAAVRGYTPAPCGCHLDVMLPYSSWRQSWARPLHWGRSAVSTAVFAGPDDCTGDIMLLPEHAATFAALVTEVQRRLPRPATGAAHRSAVRRVAR